MVHVSARIEIPQAKPVQKQNSQILPVVTVTQLVHEQQQRDLLAMLIEAERLVAEYRRAAEERAQAERDRQVAKKRAREEDEKSFCNGFKRGFLNRFG